jgi:hypothetical protein
MIRGSNKRRRGALALAGLALLAIPAGAAAPSGFAAFAKLQPGKWQVRELDGATPPANICLGNPEQLLRFEHRTGAPCKMEVLHNDPAGLTVQYSCPGRGFGHSALRVLTPRAVRIDSQGFSKGLPFSYKLDARRIGAC